MVSVVASHSYLDSLSSFVVAVADSLRKDVAVGLTAGNVASC